MGILVIRSVNLEKNWLILMSSVLSWKRGFIWAKKSVFYSKKGGSFWTEKSVFFCEKGVILSWKVSVLLQKMGLFSNCITRMGTTFSSEWGSRGLNYFLILTIVLTSLFKRLGAKAVCFIEYYTERISLQILQDIGMHCSFCQRGQEVRGLDWEWGQLSS